MGKYRKFIAAAAALARKNLLRGKYPGRYMSYAFAVSLFKVNTLIFLFFFSLSFSRAAEQNIA